MKSFFVAACLAGLVSVAVANESACGITTHGIPMRAKAVKVNLNDPSSLTRAFGPAQLETTSEGKKVAIWYDLLHEGNANSRTDCGVLMAVIFDGNATKATMMGLVAQDIDLLLAGRSPRLD